MNITSCRQHNTSSWTAQHLFFFALLYHYHTDYRVYCKKYVPIIVFIVPSTDYRIYCTPMAGIELYYYTIIVFIVPSTIQYLPSGYNIFRTRSLWGGGGKSRKEEEDTCHRGTRSWGHALFPHLPAAPSAGPFPPLPPQCLQLAPRSLRAQTARVVACERRHRAQPSAPGNLFFCSHHFFNFYFVACERQHGALPSAPPRQGNHVAKNNLLVVIVFFYCFLFFTLCSYIKLKHIGQSLLGQSLLPGEIFVPAQHGAWLQCDARPAGGFARPTRRARGSDRREDWQKGKTKVSA